MTKPYVIGTIQERESKCQEVSNEREVFSKERVGETPGLSRVGRTMPGFNDNISERKFGSRLHVGIAGSYHVLVSSGCRNILPQNGWWA